MSEQARPLAILDAMPAQVAMVDGDGTIVFVNEAWRQFGEGNGLQTPGHGLGANYLRACEAGGDADGMDAAAGVRGVIDGSLDTFTFEYPCHSPTQQRWFMLRAMPVAEACGRGAVVMHVDVSERRRIAGELTQLAKDTERRERMFANMLSSSADLTYAIDRQRRVIYANEATLALWRLPLQEAVGRTSGELGYPRELSERLDRQIDHVFATGDSVTDETPFPDPQGEPGHFEYILSPAFAADGSVDFVVGCSRDITARKRANEELQRQRSELRTLFDLVPAHVWFKDTEGRVVQLNERAAASMGLGVEEALGRQIYDMYPELAKRYRMEDQLVVASGRPLLGQIERFVDVDGGTLWVQSDKVPLRDEEGRVIGIIVMKHDITERKRTEEALNELNATLEARVRERTAELAQAHEEAQRANQAKSAFLATMSHEIRTPMTGLLGLLELLELTSLDAEQRSTLGVIQDSGRALQRIIDGILDFSKIEADSLELDVAPASIRSVVQGVCRLHDPIASGKQLQLCATVSPEVSAYLQFDAVRLGQILNNFVSNAIKFTQAGSVDVLVECEARQGVREDLRITVCDTGMGIPPDRIGRLFRPFAQADARIATEFGGTGLGLFIARRLAERMGGSVALESEPGRGTSVVLRVGFEVCEQGLGLAEVNEASRRRLSALMAARPAAPDVEEAARCGTLLLVVDDHPINRMVLMRQASTLGYAAEPAVDGVEALAKWCSGRFGAVLTDCNMPGMNGFELAAAIRQREAGSPLHTPIIGCTANAMAEATAACLAAGMDDAITKPIALEDLYARLDRWLPLPPADCEEPGGTGWYAGDEAAVAVDLVDMHLVVAIAGGEHGSVEAVLANLRSCNEADALRLRDAVAREDLQDIVQVAHRMAGACGVLGATALADATAAILAAARRGELEPVLAAMPSFEQAFAEIDAYLQDKLVPAPAT